MSSSLHDEQLLTLAGVSSSSSDGASAQAFVQQSSMPLLPLLADVSHGEWCRLVKKPPMPSMATMEKPPSEITKKKPSVIAKKKPSVITEKKPSVITEKKPSVITKKKPSVITKKKPSVVITTKKLSINTKNRPCRPGTHGYSVWMNIEQLIHGTDEELFPIKQLIHGRDEEAFLKIRQETRRHS